MKVIIKSIFWFVVPTPQPHWDYAGKFKKATLSKMITN